MAESPNTLRKSRFSSPARVAVLRALFLAATAVVAAACGGSSTTPTPDPGTAPVVSSFGANPTSITSGSASTLSWVVTGATSLAIDQGVGVVTGTSVSVRPTATTTYKLTATNSAGDTVSSPVTVTVNAVPSHLEVACSGANCSAATATRYTRNGSGIGVWRYQNRTAAPVKIDVDIVGVNPGLETLLLFSNGSDSTKNTAPSPLTSPTETLLQAALPTAADLEQEARHQAQWRITEHNRAVAREFVEMVRSGAAGGAALQGAPEAPRPTPPIGERRPWYDMDSIDLKKPIEEYYKAYTAEVRDICTLSNGRKAVFWVDDASWKVNVLEEDLKFYKKVLCDTGKGYDQVKTMIGDGWGTHVFPNELITQDAVGALQDLNVVYLSVPATKTWGGYFWNCNNFKKGKEPSKYCPGTNEALAFFVNAPRSKGQQNFYASLHLHELTHLVNYYQRTLQKEYYDVWLEETSAMMTEDIIVPAVTEDIVGPSGEKVRINEARDTYVYSYVKSGGAASLMVWNASNSYEVGGSLGAFLNRRYGTAIYTGMKGCPVEKTDAGTSYACLDKLVRDNKGVGLAEEFDRMGASIYGLFPAKDSPPEYGFPTATYAPYTLDPIDIPDYWKDRLGIATALPKDKAGNVEFRATSHTYKLDAIPVGETKYSRPGVEVPAGTSLLVVMRPVIKPVINP